MFFLAVFPQASGAVSLLLDLQKSTQDSAPIIPTFAVPPYHTTSTDTSQNLPCCVCIQLKTKHPTILKASAKVGKRELGNFRWEIWDMGSLKWWQHMMVAAHVGGST